MENPYFFETTYEGGWDWKKEIERQNKAEKIYRILKNTNSINEVTDIVDSLDLIIARLVIKKFVYGG